MQLEEIHSRLRALEPELRARGVAHIAVFGSRARGDARPDSDVDLLLEVPQGSLFSILDLVGVESLVADSTGLTANIFMKRGLDRAFSESIKADIRQVF